MPHYAPPQPIILKKPQWSHIWTSKHPGTFISHVIRGCININQKYHIKTTKIWQFKHKSGQAEIFDKIENDSLQK